MTFFKTCLCLFLEFSVLQYVFCISAVCLLLHRLLAYGSYISAYKMASNEEPLLEHAGQHGRAHFVSIKWEQQVQYPDFHASIILIASGIRVLAWLKKKERKNKLAFWLVAALLPWYCWRALLTVSLARAAFKMDRNVLQSVQHLLSFQVIQQSAL